MSDERIILKKKTAKTAKRLGMGLSALLGDLEEVDIFSTREKTLEDPDFAGIPLKGYTILPVEKLAPNAAQPRKFFNEDELLTLSNSIMQNGLLQPILVRKLEDDLYQIVAGERRYRASKLAGLKEVPCIIRELSDSEVFILAIIENVQREDLNPLEEAEGYSRLVKDFNYTQDQIAEIIGKSRSHIANLMRLTKLPQAVKNHVLEGKLTGGHVRPLLALKTDDQIINIAEVIIDNNYSVRKVEELVNLILNDEEKLESLEGNLLKINTTNRNKAEHSEAIQSIIKAFKEALQVQVSIKQKKEGGIISIKYKNQDDLNNILQNFSKKNNQDPQVEPKQKIPLPGREDFLTLNI